MFRSLRITLLFWYAVMFTGAIAALGTSLHRELRATLYQETDAQLGHWCTVLQRCVADAATPAAAIASARSALPDEASMAVFDSAGKVVASAVVGLSAVPLVPTEPTTRDDHRWLGTELPAQAGWLVVGRSVQSENHAIRRFLWMLAAAGIAVTALALVGGFVMVTRALAPVHATAAVAQRISARNLGERIPAARVPQELRGMVTTLNESFARLEASFAAQMAFTADASHELRTPLAIVLAHLELAASPEQSGAAIQERLVACRHAAQRMESILAGLLHLARADAGALSIEATPIDFAQLVEAEVAAIEPLARRFGIEAIRFLQAVSVCGDTERLRVVVANLLDNAVRYNRPGGEVRVHLAREGTAAVLRISDTGIGIAPEHLVHVFDRFYRVDASRTRATGGSGLGLAIVRRLVECHRGSIDVASQPGHGSEFVVRLPLGPAPA